MAWMGTFVSAGYGVGMAVETGDATAVGELAETIQTIEDEETPLQEEMKHLSKVMLIIIVILVIGIFAIGLFRGESLHEMLLTSIAIAVASIPEGLPAAVTIILAVGMDALLRRGGLVRNLLAAETLGSTTYVLTDKTGTLTQAKMSVASVTLRDSKELAPDVWETNIAARELFDIALSATDAFVDEQSDGSLKINGEPMERAVLLASREVGLTASGQSARGKRIDFLAFTSENRFAAGLSVGKEANLLCINGSPEHVLAASTHVASLSGVQKMTEEDRTYFLREIERMTSTGARLMAVAYQKKLLSQIFLMMRRLNS